MSRPDDRAPHSTPPARHAAPGSTGTPDSGPDDARLRDHLRQLRAPHTDNLALQQRVLAQWRVQTHTAAALGSAALPDGSGTLGWLGALPGTGWRRLGRRGLASLALLALLTALSVWWARPDPALTELLQPDVLSQMGLGEL